MVLEDFNDIRSYTDAEIPAAMEYFINDELSLQVAKTVFPDTSLDDIKGMLKSIKTIDQFQKQVMTRFVSWIVKNSMKRIDTQNFNYIEKGKAYLFTGNHRDINQHRIHQCHKQLSQRSGTG